MSIVISGSGTITGVTTLATTVTNQVLTTPTVTSTMGVGNATPSASGAGITFPATQSPSSDANTLDDYEEGTWTPVLTFNGGNTGMTITSSGTYTKIGNSVRFFGIIQVSAKGSSTGQVIISGLPFNNSPAGQPVYFIVGSLVSISSQIQMYISSSSIYLEQINTGSQTPLTHSNVGNISTFYVSGVYAV